MSPQGISSRRAPASHSSRSASSSGSRDRRRTTSYRRGQTPPKRLSKKQIIITSLIAIVAVAVLGLAIDVVSNFGKIHKGVTVQGIEVGGMTQTEAAAVLEQQIGALLSDEPVDLFASEMLELLGVDNKTVELNRASTIYQADTDYNYATSWRITSTTVGASIDSAKLAEDAYAVGRGSDFISGRLRAVFIGADLTAELSYEHSQLEALESLIETAIGDEMRNADIRFDNGRFVVIPGAAGNGVDHESFIPLLDQAFLGSKRSVVVPMGIVVMDISYEEAAEFAAKALDAVSQPVTLVYNNEESWDLDPYSLGSCVRVTVEGTGDNARLVPWISEALLRDGVNGVIGGRDPGIRPQDARFELVNGWITVVPSVNGTGIDYAKVARDLGNILFPSGAALPERKVQLSVTSLEPAFTTEQAEALHITDRIASYSTEYPYATSAKMTNIHLASDLINYSLIEPGGVWSFNDTAGECNAEKGFQEAPSIIEGEYVDEIGGGICQVATTVYNAVFESGLPIVERVNHGFYLIAYPAGRDATVSWRWPDLKFENDTDNWVLLAMSYTDTSVTCTLWGTDPGYQVEIVPGDFTDRTDYSTKRIDNPELPKGEERIKQEGVRGRTIIVTRSVYNKQGELLRKTDFKSVYEPETEIIEVGTKEVEQPAAEGAEGG